jgi:crotonobetainyl-CoA:carnitine CoA-transferase CaiB-like acyl-CoA transferase
MSQAEAALHFLAPGYLDYTVNGQLRSAVGNEDPNFSPHDCFPCAGEDRWIAIAIETDAQWKALCSLMDRADLVAQRSERDAIHAAICEWTRGQDAGGLERILQESGIPAHVAHDTLGLAADEQMNARGHYYEIAHEIYQTHTVESSRLRLSRSPEKRSERALSFGRDNRLVLETILGYSQERIEALERSGVLGAVEA